MELIHGKAPQDLPDLKFNKCFLGGSDGKLEAIFEYLEGHLEAQGILCANFVTPEKLKPFSPLVEGLWIC